MDSEEGLLMIWTSMAVLLAFLITVLAVMLIYRRRRMQHLIEISAMEQRFRQEQLQTQLEVQEQTMQHISREIHDNVGQQLTLAFLYSQQIRSADTGIIGQVHVIGSIISQALNDLRALSKNLGQLQFLDQPLETLLHNECRKVEATGLCEARFTFSFNSDVEVPDPIKSFVLRLFQEFLQNSLKHANCTSIEATLQQTSDSLILEVSDNGRGFDVNENNGVGIGLSNMRKRAAMIEADFTLESAIDEGTKMLLAIPNHKLIISYAS